ncbi:transcription initiation factor IIF subunit alpha [Heterostelium album PN500]|uniref:Transcription initiation factor IIF subunit alpha n=1 Tax=Heterostelium pallidum (strain ATCC 26659 / Pp 5 / PN500) TaxID=670386 RepID=D3BL08_HETP5|nr:transcription initiation factor IIF subunit alpha [Heterostelium album PN500]EFA78588.1 transcription initiation factor IIF subunit alpha [Heterostelium album PN500]|eukprot:XP_020430712.1 transcription initiation factor IIF subunit alpha [Heterostelium album PN500]
MNNNNGFVKKEEDSNNNNNNDGGKVYPIVLANTTKRWNIAKFTTKVDIPSFEKPVKMYKYKPDLSENPNADGNNNGTGDANPNAAQQQQKKKKYEPKPVNPKTIPWRLEDSEGNNAFQGMIEGNQASSYFVFMFQSDHTIKAVPCSDWYTFRMRKDIEALTIEEAEAFMSKKTKEREDWNGRMTKKTTDTGASSSSNTEGKKDDEGDKEDDEYRKEIYEEKDKFKASFGASKKKRRGGEEDEEEMGEGDDEDAPDFDSKFDDDDEAFEDNDITTEDGPQIDAEDEDIMNEHLTAAGVEMKNIIKNMGKQDSSEDEDNDEDEKSDSGDDDDEEEPDDDDFTLTKENLNFRNTYPKVGVKEEPKSPGGAGGNTSGNGSSKTSTTTTTTTTTTSSSSNNTPPNKKKPAATAAAKKIGSPPDQQTVGAKKGVKNKAETSVATTPSNSNKKLKSDQTPPTSPPTSPSASQSTEEYPLTEESIKKVLRAERKITSIDLIQLFKTQLRTKDQKDLFMKYTNKLANIVKEGDVRYLVLKPGI